MKVYWFDKQKIIWRWCVFVHLLLFSLFANAVALADNIAPNASLSLKSADENQEVCFPASSLAKDPDGDSLSVSLVEGFTEVGQERLASYWALYPKQTQFAPGETIGLNATKSRDKLGQRGDLEMEANFHVQR